MSKNTEMCKLEELNNTKVKQEVPENIKISLPVETILDMYNMCPFSSLWNLISRSVILLMLAYSFSF